MTTMTKRTTTSPFLLLLQDMQDDEDKDERRRQLAKKTILNGLFFSSQMTKRLEDSAVRKKRHSSRKKRSVKRIQLGYIEDNGTMTTLTPKKTFWYYFYVANGHLLSKKGQEMFRRRFRMSFDCYEELFEILYEHPSFLQWKEGSTDCCGSSCAPLSLLLLGTLRYLGRGTTMDDIVEATAISETTIRLFIHSFIDFGSKVLFEKFVTTPTTKEEAQTHMVEMTMAGFPGCVGSTDATHVPVEILNPSKKLLANFGAKLSRALRV